MPKYHFLRADGSYSDVANYPETPEDREGGQWVEGEPPQNITPFVNKDLNQKLEELMLSLMPNHIGQPYMTGTVINQIMTLKGNITDCNRLGFYGLSKLMLMDSVLPEQMEDDKAAILAAFPA